MSQKVYPVQTRKSPHTDEWRTTGEKATLAAVNKYNKYHGWDKARLDIPVAESSEGETISGG